MNELRGKIWRALVLTVNMSREDSVREKIKILLNCGVKNVVKLAELTGVCRGTVYNFIKRLELDGNVKRKPGTGRPRKRKPADRHTYAA